MPSKGAQKKHLPTPSAHATVGRAFTYKMPTDGAQKHDLPTPSAHATGGFKGRRSSWVLPSRPRSKPLSQKSRPRPLQPDQHDAALRIFKRFDATGTGTISRDELNVAMKELLGKKVNAKELTVLIGRIDKTGEGINREAHALA
jgi:hypothetical protein